MSIFRFKSLEKAISHTPAKIEEPKTLRSELFGIKVFDKEKMRKYMTKDAYKHIMDVINKGQKIDRKVADQVANAMKTWALNLGATHYTHWFQPLTGATAEKHDAFLEVDMEGTAIEKFGGGQLVQQEPDASSFPNGGIRNTFEARGYTAWDPSSPAFIYENTLCIPTIFISYTGEALDYKTPLLKALNALNKAATDVAKYFDRKVQYVFSTLGIEQEYFLVDSALYHNRPDLILTGRTLLGHTSPKGQQLEDHYFGSISKRVMHFMKDLEMESIKLGIPVKTRHNEVAPNQFELAPTFEETNLAVDHNSLMMDLMKKIAKRHHFEVLLHEKPFAGINGSGKHNNWSLMTDTGVNLLSPGSTPMNNLQFLTFFINIIQAVNRYEELLRASIASAGNDHRLGANEAPPAIISIFIGDQLTKVLDQLEKVSVGRLSPKEKTDIKLNIIGKIPDVLLDNTDRNRTSPFAFTGNKFEFRAVGSHANSASPMTVLNTIVAKQLKEFKTEVETLRNDKGLSRDEAILNVLREYIKKSKRIRFEGNGYSEEWQKEAAKRGLSNNKSTPDALRVKVAPESIELFEEMSIMNEVETHARYEIELEEYIKRIQIEGRVLGDIARNHVIPTAINYQNRLIKNVLGIKDIYPKEFKKHASEQLKLIEKISLHIEKVSDLTHRMIEARKKANAVEDMPTRADMYCDEVKPYFDEIRYHCDKLEIMVDDEIWPLAKYREMLFIK